MKYLTTTKAIKNGYCNIVCAGYCDLQYLLRYVNPVAYTRGVYGWNYDVYDVNRIAICTGYRGMPGRRANNITAYEARAREIDANSDLTWTEKQEKTLNLMREFCAQA